MMSDRDKPQDEAPITTVFNVVTDGAETEPGISIGPEVLAGLSACRLAIKDLAAHDRAAVLRILAAECGFELAAKQPPEASGPGETFRHAGPEWAQEYVAQVLLSDALLGAAVGLDEAKREIDGVVERLAEAIENRSGQLDGSGPRPGQSTRAVGTGTFSCDGAGRFLDVNPAVLTLLGYESKEQLIAERTLASLFPDAASWDGLRAFLCQYYRVQHIERELAGRDGRRVRVLLTATANIDTDGEACGFEGTWFDVTERQRLQEQLVAALRLDAARQVALACTHEICQPLAVLCNYAHLLLKRCEIGGQDLELPRAICKQTARLAEITGKIRRIRRIRTKRGAGDMRMLDLDASVRTG